MSDDFSTYMRKVEAMFAEATGQMEEIAKVWVLRITRRLVLETPGPGLQYPYTDYIATGRLRGGWEMGREAPASVGLYGHGIEDVDGSQTVARMGATLSIEGMGGVFYAWNNVGYGLYVHEGLEKHAHIGPRPWVQIIADDAPAMLDEARREVMAKRFADYAVTMGVH